MLRPMERLAESRLLAMDVDEPRVEWGSPRDGGCDCAGDSLLDLVADATLLLVL
jgi:hypothetical protein